MLALFLSLALTALLLALPVMVWRVRSRAGANAKLGRLQRMLLGCAIAAWGLLGVRYLLLAQAGNPLEARQASQLTSPLGWLTWLAALAGLGLFLVLSMKKNNTAGAADQPGNERQLRMTASEIEYAYLPPGREKEAAQLVEEVFRGQVAPLYSQEGVEEFLKYAAPQAVEGRLAAHNFILAASGPQGLVGVVEADEQRGHIVWFFVADQARGMGVGRELMRRAVAELKRRRPDLHRVTVNSSPNAVAVYLALGFTPSDHQQEHNGIKFTPMTLLLD